MLNADADLMTAQDLLGRAYIRTTRRYCRVSNQKVRWDYYKAINEVLERHRIVQKRILNKKGIMINKRTFKTLMLKDKADFMFYSSNTYAGSETGDKPAKK